MRGSDKTSGSLFSYVDLESRVPAKHPLRVIKAIVDDVLVSLDGEFERLYEGTGRQSIAPERLLRAVRPQDPNWRSKPWPRPCSAHSPWESDSSFA